MSAEPAASDPVAVDRVRVWTADTESPDLRSRIGAYGSLLSGEEIDRADRFVHEEDAVRFVIGRVLARTLLSQHAAVAPGDWQFVIDRYGRPHLAAPPPGGPDLRFNLSHTRGLVACAVTVGREVGIDVEHVDRQVTHDLPERFFAPQEVADLRALPEAEQPAAFFDYWTLKEAYIKARGLGLALPLRQFAFRRTPAGPPSIAFASELDDDPSTWQFAQYWPTRRHRLAVAVRRRGADLPIAVEPCVPEGPA